MTAKADIIDALVAGKQTGPEIAKTLGVSLQYVCRIAAEIKCRPKPCALGRPVNNCKQENVASNLDFCENFFATARPKET